MAFRTSYSQNNMYTQCPQHWSLSYQHKIKSDIEGASLYFGSAVDKAIMVLLENKGDPVAVFKDNWNRAFNNGKVTTVFDNENIVFSNADFDEYVLKDKDKGQMLIWASELNLGDGPDPVEIFKEVAKVKKNPHRSTSVNQIKYFNRCSWLSLKRKGEILINAFIEQFLPRIEQVLACQKYGKVEDSYTKDTIAGYIDLVLKLKGEDKPIIFDLKTAAQPYTQEQIDLTEQLTLYSAMKGNEYGTDKVGYIVLCKNIQKDTVAFCKSCGHKKDGRHQTCNNKIGGARCDGEWEEKKELRPEVQVMIETKTTQQVDDLLRDYSNIMLAMKNNIVYKNTSKCNNWYGSKCVYYDLCHKGSMKGLRKEEKK